MASPAVVQLVPMSPESKAAFPLFNSSEPAPSPNYYTSRHVRARTRSEMITEIIGAALPLILHFAGLIALIGCLLQVNNSYLTLIETDGTGRIDYGVLASCAIAPNLTTQVCTPFALAADFLPSLLLISPTVPGFAIFQLPIHSSQTPAVFISSLVILFTSFLFLLPAWTAIYFPNLPINRSISSVIKRYTRELYLIGGSLAFLSFVLTVTIGIGYRELLIAAANNFTDTSDFEFRKGTIGSVWIPEIGQGFHLVWTASALSALSALGVNVALHNGLDERVTKTL